MNDALAIALPRSIVSGDSFSFELNDGVHGTDLWTAKFAISALVPIVVDGTVVEGVHSFLLTAAVSTNIPFGYYATCVSFLKGQERETIQGPPLYVLPNPLTAITPSWAMATLTETEAAIRKIAKAPNATVSVNGETYTKANLDTLMKFRDRLINIVSGELATMGRPSGGSRRTVRTRFVS